MSSASEKIQALKLLLGDRDLDFQQNREFLKAPQLRSGIPRGIIVELMGPAKTEWLLHFLQGHPDTRVFWGEKESHILPTAFAQRGVDLNRMTFGVLGQDPVISLRRILQSQLYPFVVAPTFPDLQILKAFQLFTEKANSLLFLMGGAQASKAWPISLQLQIQRAPEQNFSVEVLKQKYGGHA